MKYPRFILKPTKVQTSSYKCKVCGAGFEQAIELASHVRKEHPKERKAKNLREVPVKEILIATDGKTVIDEETRKRGRVVEVIAGMKVMKDDLSGLEWLERAD